MHKLICALLILSGSHAFSATNACSTFDKVVGSGPPSSRLKKFIDSQWKYTMTEYPEYATYIGYPGQNDRWTDQSLEAIARRDKETICQLKALKKINRKALKGTDLINYDLLLDSAEIDVEGIPFPGEFLAISHLDGIHTSLPDMMESMPKTTVKDLQNMLSRLEKAPQVIAQTEALLREGLRLKVTPVKMFLERLPAQFDQVLTPKIEDSPIYKAFDKTGSEISATDKAKAQERAKELLQNSVVPALTKFKEFLVKEYIPNARESISWKDMPDGTKWYALLTRVHTTTKLKPEELHEIGLKEVARIETEMKKIRDQLKFKGEPQEFNHFLLTDRRFYYTDKDALLAGYRDIAKRIDPELPKLFKTLPRLPYGVREMPDYKAKDSPTAYYMGGSLEAGRAGFFEANTYDLKARPKWGMEALTLHEAVPGHHLQISIAQELQGLPEFRKQGHYTAFVEGWGLYAERLGEEIGMYKDPYSKYGQLSYEMWRAVRLVVDTGMHQLGWSRDKSIEYMMSNLPKSKLESEVEIDRYITWPGQALAYKVGEMKFRELRERARTALGTEFDVREFHDELLKNGALPIDVLDKSIDAWISKRKKRKKA